MSNVLTQDDKAFETEAIADITKSDVLTNGKDGET